MVRISTSLSTKLFGGIDGIHFWLKWRIWIKIELFYYRCIIHKKWCTEHGYSCNNDCLYEKHDEPDEYTEFEMDTLKIPNFIIWIKSKK